MYKILSELNLLLSIYFCYLTMIRFQYYRISYVIMPYYEYISLYI